MVKAVNRVWRSPSGLRFAIAGLKPCATLFVLVAAAIVGFAGDVREQD